MENVLKARRLKKTTAEEPRTVEWLSHIFFPLLFKWEINWFPWVETDSLKTNKRILLWETRGISDWKMSGRPRTTSFAESCKPVPQPSAFGSMKVSSKYHFRTPANLLLVLCRGYSCCWPYLLALITENGASVHIDRGRHMRSEIRVPSSVTFGWNMTCPILNRSACFSSLLNMYRDPAMG